MMKIEIFEGEKCIIITRIRKAHKEVGEKRNGKKTFIFNIIIIFIWEQRGHA